MFVLNSKQSRGYQKMAAAAEVMFRSMNFANKLFKPQNVNNVFNKEQIKTVAVSRFYATAATEKGKQSHFFKHLISF